MDRISFSQHAQQMMQTQAPAARPIRVQSPSTALRAAGVRDTLELSSTARPSATTPVATPTSQKAQSLVAARVATPVEPAALAPATLAQSPATPNPGPMRFYANPSDQNAAATLGAGSKLDILA